MIGGGKRLLSTPQEMDMVGDSASLGNGTGSLVGGEVEAVRSGGCGGDGRRGLW